jgi:MFS family permease
LIVSLGIDSAAHIHGNANTVADQALANAYGGALGYAILLIKSHIPSWRILFLIEGLPTLIVAVVAFFVFPDDIRSASFLTEREKFVCMHMVQRGQVADTENHTGLRVKDFLAAFTDWRSKYYLYYSRS